MNDNLPGQGPLERPVRPVAEALHVAVCQAVALLEVGFDGPQCLQAEQWAQDYAKTYTRTKLERLAIRIDQRGWEEEAEVMRAAARDTDQALTLLAMLHGRVCHMMAHLGVMGEIDTRHATIEKLGDALDDVNEFVARMVKAETALSLHRAVADWVKADAARFRWLVEDHADPGTRQAARDLLGRLGVMSYGAACDAIDSARRECSQREELMSVERGRKVGELTRKVRRQQAGRA